MYQERLIEIETKIAYQEQTVKELNEAICQQQNQIDQLQATCNLLIKRLTSLADTLPANDPLDEKPPHY